MGYSIQDGGGYDENGNPINDYDQAIANGGGNAASAAPVETRANPTNPYDYADARPEDVTAEYQKQFGRAPSQSEMDSEMQNLLKYGWAYGPDGGVQAQIDKRATNTPNSDGGGNGTSLGAVGGTGSAAGGSQGWFNQYAPQSYQPFTEQFQAPTEADMQANDPGYQTRMDAAMQAMQRSAAAKGTLLTGGFQKGMGQSMQDYGSNEYQNYYNQKVGEYGSRYNINTNNQLNSISTNRNNMLDQFGMSTTNRQLSDQENAQAFNQYLGLNTLYANVGMGLAGMGANASGNLSNAGGSIADLYAQLGNANAAGTVGSANAWNGALGNIGNTFQNAALSNRSSY